MTVVAILSADENNVLFTLTDEEDCDDYYETPMTKTEIERELGYPIKIIG